jgi:hypothetical protein
MPMIDVYAAAGTFSDKHRLAQDLAKAVMKWENVPPINLFKKNTAGFIHDLPSEPISNAAWTLAVVTRRLIVNGGRPCKGTSVP